MAKLPLQYNIINREHQSTSDEDIPGAWVYLDDGNYNGNITGYLEVIAKVGGAESVDVELHNPGDTVKASVTVTATSYTRYRSTSFSLDSGGTLYNLVSNNISGETLDLRAGRIILIQENASGNITETEIQIDINAGEGEVWSPSAYQQVLRSASRYHRYVAADWDPQPHTDGNCAIYLEVVYAVSDGMYDVNFYLTEGDKFYDDWDFPYTLLTGGTSETPARVRSSDISSYINDGVVYCLGYATEDDKAGRGVTIYQAKLIFYLYDTGGIDKLRTQWLMLNETPGTGGDSQMEYQQYFDPDDVDGYGFYALSMLTCASSSFACLTRLEKTSDQTELPGSETFNDTSGGEHRNITWLFKVVGSVPPNHLIFSATITKRAQGIYGKGGKIWRIWAFLRREGTLTGNVYAKIYAATGTPGTDSIPTGSALATSNAVAASSILDTDVSLIWGDWVYFDFPDPFDTTNDTDYFVSIEYDGSDATNYLEFVDYDDLNVNYNSAYYDGSWSGNYATTDHSVEKYEAVEFGESAVEFDIWIKSYAVWLYSTEVAFHYDVALLGVADLSIDETDAVETTTVTDVVTDVLIPGPTLLINETDAVETVVVSESVPRPDVAYDAAEMITTPSYDTEPGAANYRVIVPASDIDFEGEQIRVLLLGDDSVTLNITGCSIGLRESVSEDYEVAAFQKLTFGGADGVAIPAGGEVFSDWEDFPCDEAEDYLVHIYVAAAHEYPWEAD